MFIARRNYHWRKANLLSSYFWKNYIEQRNVECFHQKIFRINRTEIMSRTIMSMNKKRVI